MNENQLDPIDIRLLKELTFDARMPFIQLAQKLKVSNTLIHQRLKKLKDKGVIKNARYEIDPLALGFHTSAYTQIILSEAKRHREMESKLAEIPEIVECVNIAGRYALMVRIFARDNRHLRDIIYEKIHAIDGVEGTNTTISFETAFVRSIPLALD